jgi:hypothetical protein
MSGSVIALVLALVLRTAEFLFHIARRQEAAARGRQRQQVLSDAAQRL